MVHKTSFKCICVHSFCISDLYLGINHLAVGGADITC